MGKLIKNVADSKSMKELSRELPGKELSRERPIKGVDIDRLRRSIKLTFPPGANFVGAYAKIKVKVRGIIFDDLHFVVREGAPGGYISPCRDAEFNAKNPDIMLCFGYKPGTYHLDVRLKSSLATLLHTVAYDLDTVWKDHKNGPSFSFYGINSGGDYAIGAAWGGGIVGQPQNVNTIPQSGTRKIALLLVDTASQRYTTDDAELQAIKDKWLNNIKNGLSVGGVTRSCKTYYKEVSYNNFDIDCDIFGPVHLSENYDELHFDDGSSIPTYAERCIAKGDHLINYNNYQTVIFVVQPWDTTDAMGKPITKFPWPIAWGYPVSTEDANNIPLSYIQMPHNWDVLDGRPIYATASHEIGHNIGLRDQYGKNIYSTAINNRTLEGWDLMAHERYVPHITIAHRLMFGWLQPEWIKCYNFSANYGERVNDTIRLYPIENKPPEGGFSGIEIRIADGCNYYVEYRKKQEAQIGDYSLPTDSAVLVTDVISGFFEPPVTRPLILKVRNDSDGDGSVLVNGLDYKETDLTDSNNPNEFKITVNDIDDTKADVTIQYGYNGKPDPAITPWPASSERPWQSPDIEIQNERNRTDSSWFNVPWAGQHNTVIAKIKNRGNINAPHVKAEFYVKNFTVGGSPETFLGEDTHDINALSTVDFKTEWIPSSEGHYCIVVRIPLYSFTADDGTTIIEMTDTNNVAQSNYDRFISDSASPATRKISFIEVGNPYTLPTVVFINPHQTNPLYRTYLEHKSLYLNPGETRKIKIMFEYDPEIINSVPVSLGDNTMNETDRRQLPEQVYKEYCYMPNHARFASFIYNPHDQNHHVELLGGAEVQVVTGRKTEFGMFYYKEFVGGTLITVDDGQRVTQGKIIIIIRKQMKEGNIVEVYETIPLTVYGEFQYRIQDDKASTLLSVQAYYLPAPGFGDCYSNIITFG